MAFRHQLFSQKTSSQICHWVLNELLKIYFRQLKYEAFTCDKQVFHIPKEKIYATPNIKQISTSNMENCKQNMEKYKQQQSFRPSNFELNFS